MSRKGVDLLVSDTYGKGFVEIGAGRGPDREQLWKSGCLFCYTVVPGAHTHTHTHTHIPVSCVCVYVCVCVFVHFGVGVGLQPRALFYIFRECVLD